jgi:hypothetical protein
LFLEILEFLDLLDALDRGNVTWYGVIVVGSGSALMDTAEGKKRIRGGGSGSSFFALGPDVWGKLQTAPTSNRLHFIMAYLVLLAGTGSDHRLTKWSAKACDEYVGIGKPRAKHAIEELIAAGLVRHTDASTRMAPQYELPELPRDAEPIFLPVQIVTGLGQETPVLRRVREAGDPLLLVLLIDLYAAIITDATHGVPINEVRQLAPEPSARKISETGVHALWGLTHGYQTQAWQKPWVEKQLVPGPGKKPNWQPLWDRLDLLKKMGAIWWEPWVFDSDAPDAEPLMPVDLGVLSSYAAADDEAKLILVAFRATLALLAERTYMMDSSGSSIFLPLPVHHRPPALRGVLRLRVEADTPGRRRAYAKRRSLVEGYQAGFEQVLADAEEFRFDRPLHLDFTGS